MAWLEQAAVTQLTDVKGEHLALSSYLHACGLLNQFLKADLERNREFIQNQQKNAGINPFPTESYVFLWIDKIHLPAYSARYLAWLTQSVILALRHPISETNNSKDDMDIDLDSNSSQEDSLALEYWKCVDEAATIFFHCCFVGQFVKNLISDPQCEQLLLAVENILCVSYHSKKFRNVQNNELILLF